MIAVIRTLRPYLRPHRRLLLIAAIAMLGEVVTTLAMPWPLKYIVDSVLFTQGADGESHLRETLGGHEIKLLIVISVAALFIAGLNGLFSYIDDRATEVAAQRAVFELRRSLFSHLQGLSIAFHHDVDTQVGDLLSRLGGDMGALQDLASTGISKLVTNGLSLITAVGIMFWLDWRLATVALALTAPLYVVAQRVVMRMKNALRAVRKHEGQVSSVLQESLSSMKLVQAYGREEHEEKRLTNESSKSLDASLEASGLQARMAPILGLMATVSGIVVTAYGAVLVLGRHITPGVLMIFLGYLRSMQSPLKALAKLSYLVTKASASTERLNEVFARVPAVAERPGAKTLSNVAGRVRLENVTFGYRSGTSILQGVSLEAHPGQVVALVGPTGAGKSTLVSLIARFYDPWEGRILIDGVDIANATLRSLRAQIALVLQDSLIFRATLRENIAYGRPEGTPTEIEAAAEAAGVDAIARRLPKGYDTVVSERGSTLSGGEKQCIGIARAILKDTPIVILDEPTSSMDSFTETRVLEGLSRLLEHRTAFVIAHRLTTIRNADVVAVLQDGRLAEVGTPSELVHLEGGLFATLARSQELLI